MTVLLKSGPPFVPGRKIAWYPPYTRADLRAWLWSRNYRRFNALWTREDDDLLESGYASGREVRDMAVDLGRTVGGLYSRIQVMGYTRQFDEVESSERVACG